MFSGMVEGGGERHGKTNKSLFFSNTTLTLLPVQLRCFEYLFLEIYLNQGISSWFLNDIASYPHTQGGGFDSRWRQQFFFQKISNFRL